MKIININISRGEIDAELSKITAYAGAKTPSADVDRDYDRIATVDEDAAMLNRYWHNSGNTLADCLKDFITGFQMDDSVIALTLEVSGAFDESLTPSVEGDLKSFVAAAMARAWFAITLPDRAAEWEGESNRLLRDASRKLYHRRRPQRQLTTDNQQRQQ